MAEPGANLDRSRVPRVVPRTERLDLLLAGNVFARQGSEHGKLSEQKRDALLAAISPDGTAVQLFVDVSRDLESAIISVNITPTNGALTEHPDLSSVRFHSSGTVMSDVLRVTFGQLRAAGYNPDTGGLDIWSNDSFWS